MNTDKVNGYIFWLSEYLSRRFFGTSEFQLLMTSIKNTVEEFEEHYSWEKTENLAARFKRIVTSKEFKNIDECDEDRQLTEQEVHLLESFRAAKTAFQVIQDKTLKPYGVPTHRNKIVKMALDESYQPVSTATHSAFIYAISNCLLPENQPLSVKKTAEDGVVIFPSLRIDLNQDINMIVTKFQYLVAEAKNTVVIEDEQSRAISYMEHVFSAIEADDTNYSLKSNTPRAVGIWLWDYVEENKCSRSKAISAYRAAKFSRDPYGASDNRVFHRLYKNTEACIKCSSSDLI